MSFSLRDLIWFFSGFETAIAKDAAPGVMESVPRTVSQLLDLFRGYSGRIFELKEVDLSNMEEGPLYCLNPHEVYSLVLHFGQRAEIYINSMNDYSGKPLVNYCNRRFYAIKEAYHVILREEFTPEGFNHPDTAEPKKLQLSIEQMVFLPFSILDLDNPKYSDAERIEHAAELLSLLTLYPIEAIATDRKDFLRGVGVANFEHPAAMVASTRNYAEMYKIPQRYVDLAFRWSDFPKVLTMYRDAKRF